MMNSNVLDEIKPKGKVYTETMIAMAAFFCGPLAAGYLFIENYKTLEQSYKVKKAWTIAILGTLFLVGLDYVLEEFIRVPMIGFGVVSVLITKHFYKKEQEKEITRHIEQGGALHSAWRATGISLLILCVVMAVVFAVTFGFYYVQPTSTEASIEMPTVETSVDEFQTRSYGAAAHVIVYNQGDISGEAIDDLAERLTILGFFDEENQKVVYLEINLIKEYSFSITDASADPASSVTQTLYKNTKIGLENSLLDSSVELLLMNEGLEEVLARF
ncbi:MAG: hypothetical protein ACRBFS_00650 [Aureispira sp.]